MKIQSLFTGNSIDINFQDDLPLMCYSVLVSRDKKHYMGYVCSHLSILDWCKLHKYKIEHLYPNTRKAMAGDKTNLRFIGDKKIT